MTKIAFVRFPFASQLGGEELHTLKIAQDWHAEGHHVKFWGSCRVLHDLFAAADLDTEFFRITAPPVTYWSLLKFTLFYPLWWLYARRLARRLIKEDYTHVYCLNLTEKLLLPLFLPLEVKIFFIEHARIGNWLYKNPWRQRYYRFVESGWVQLVTVSTLMRQQLQKQQANLPVTVIPNGIDLAFFRERLPENLLTVEAACLTPALVKNTPLIVHIARLTEDKGVADFIESLALLVKQGCQDWEAVVVGTGPLKSKLISSAQNLGIYTKINFVDSLSRPAVAALLQRAQILCLLSRQADPFGLVVPEALAAGCQVVATDVCGVTDYTAAINVVKPQDVAGVAKILQRVLGEGRGVAEAELAKFDQQQMLTAYRQLLH